MAGGLISWALLIYIIISAVTCGIGIALHELAHRVVARAYGSEAHVVSDHVWLILSVVIAFAGWFVAAPGAVWHSGYLTRQQSGLIALAGPVTNLVLALVFLLLHLVVGVQDFGGLMRVEFGVINVWFVGYHINAWLGLFNMIPLGPLDGAKVFNWNKVVFGITAAVAVVMTFLVPGIFGM